MSWNHRLLFKDGVVTIVECFYNDDGSCAGYCSAEAVADMSDDLDPVNSIKRQLKHMKKACKERILVVEDFIGFNDSE